MSNPPISQTYFSRETVEQDLLSTLVLFEDTVPWSLMDVEATQTLELDVKLELNEFDTVLSQGCQVFFTSLDEFWKSQSPSSPLLTDLVKRLGTQIPQAILSEIAHKAQQSLAQSKSEIDAAIQCVQDLLPQWSLDDLLVFNRPFSYAMRGENVGVERVLQTLESRTWEELSDFDQARACLAIAHFALYLAGETDS